MLRTMMLGCAFLVGLCQLMLSASPVLALTAEWERNTETDMQDYRVYGCLTAGCTVTQTPELIQATVVQPIPGVKPTWAIPPGTAGSIAVSARDTSGNESPLSVSVSFDSAPPRTPAGLVIK